MDLVSELKRITVGSQLDVVRFVLDFGKGFNGADLPPQLDRGEEKQCFMNSSLLALENDRFEYVEGYACSKSQPPFLHAWCAQEDRVVDTTLTRPTDYQYFGVIIPTIELQVWLNRGNYYGILCGDLNAEFIESYKSH